MENDTELGRLISEALQAQIEEPESLRVWAGARTEALLTKSRLLV